MRADVTDPDRSPDLHQIPSFPGDRAACCPVAIGSQRVLRVPLLSLWGFELSTPPTPAHITRS